MKIDVVMISNLGVSDGGRETWLGGFLREAKKNESEMVFSFVTLLQSKSNVLKSISGHYESVEINIRNKFFPKSLIFILLMLKNSLFSVLSKEKFDFVMGVGGFDEALAIFLSYPFRYRNAKRVIWLRTIYTKEKFSRAPRFLLNLILKAEIFLYKSFFNLCIANGEDTASYYRGYGVNCLVIPNAVDFQKWSMVNLSAKKRYNNNFIVSFIGRLTEVKGIYDFIDSVDDFNKKYDGNIEFHVVGNGHAKKDVVSRFPSIKYLGAIENYDLPEYLRGVDCCVALTLLTDGVGGGGLSNALLEQMAAGKVIIAWNNLIYRQILNDENSLIVEQGSIADLSQCYKNLIDNLYDLDKITSLSKQAAHAYSFEKHFSLFQKAIAGIRYE